MRQPGFIVLAEQLQKIRNKYKKLKNQVILDIFYIYRNELDKAYFKHDMACDDFEHLATGTTSNKM